MAFTARRIHDITILDFEGRLTFTAGEELSRRITALAAADRPKVVLNLAGVIYVDSAGLGAIVNAFMKLRDTDGGLTFVNPTMRTKHVLEITGIASLVETYASEQLAIASYPVASPVVALPMETHS